MQISSNSNVYFCSVEQEFVTGGAKRALCFVTSIQTIGTSSAGEIIPPIANPRKLVTL